MCALDATTGDRLAQRALHAAAIHADAISVEHALPDRLGSLGQCTWQGRFKKCAGILREGMSVKIIRICNIGVGDGVLFAPDSAQGTLPGREDCSKLKEGMTERKRRGIVLEVLPVRVTATDQISARLSEVPTHPVRIQLDSGEEIIVSESALSRVITESLPLAIAETRAPSSAVQWIRLAWLQRLSVHPSLPTMAAWGCNKARDDVVSAQCRGGLFFAFEHVGDKSLASDLRRLMPCLLRLSRTWAGILYCPVHVPHDHRLAFAMAARRSAREPSAIGSLEYPQGCDISTRMGAAEIMLHNPLVVKQTTLKMPFLHLHIPHLSP